MARRATGIRYATLLLLLCLVVVSQSAAFLSAGEQHKGHCCLLCHVGPVPCLSAPVTFTLTPMFSAARLESAPEFQSIRDVLLHAGSSRAPPAGSLQA